MRQGINADNLEKDIQELEYYKDLIKSDMNECFELKQDIEKYYTVPESQTTINNEINTKIQTTIKNKTSEIDLFKSKLTLYAEVVNKTESIFESAGKDIEEL